MANDTFETIQADQLNTEEAPQLLAMIYQTEIGEAVLVSTGVEDVANDSGISGIAFALVISFVAVVTISRRKPGIRPSH